MLQYLSTKFYQETELHSREPRAALFLNRFSRTSTIMFATDGLSTILGLHPTDVIGKSFYYCIEENCLKDAVKAIECAKANDTIAYLRFWYRNPLQEDNRSLAGSIGDDDEDEDGGVSLGTRMSSETRSSASMMDAPTPRQNGGAPLSNGISPSANDTSSAMYVGASDEQRIPDLLDNTPPRNDSGLAPPFMGGLTTQRSSTDQSTDSETNSGDPIFDMPAGRRSSSPGTPPEDPRVEIEAVVSCSSDGLVLILRRARPLVPHTLGATESPYYANGLFATPWAPDPAVIPSHHDTNGIRTATSSTTSASSTEEAGLMTAIRDVAAFAWSLTGINGSLIQHARGTPCQEALPPAGIPVWDPNAHVDPEANERYNGFAGSAHRPWAGPGGEPSEARKDDELGSSDDEVVWKRAPTMSTWRRPKRRGHGDAFGEDGHDRGDGGNYLGGRKRTTRSNSSSGRGSGSGGGSASVTGSSSGSS